MKQNNAIDLMSRIREQANRFIVRELAKRGVEGIVPSHGAVMVQLFDGKPKTMKELAEKIHRTKPTVTILVEKLVDYGYVFKEKSREDNRVTYIRLTERGLALKPVFQEISAKLNHVVYRGLTEQAAVELETMLININHNFQEV